jgi:hypothetical protein
MVFKSPGRIWRLEINMQIGIDISQIVYDGTGVARFVSNLVSHLIKTDQTNEYVLFAATFRRKQVIKEFFHQIQKDHPKVKLVLIPIPPILLDIFWNKWHIFPIDKLIGPIDIFWSSDWTQPPLGKVVGVTTVFDLIYLKYPQETNPLSGFTFKGFRFSPNIVATQKRRMNWVTKECSLIFCDSLSTQCDLIKYLGCNPDKLKVIYPGIN